MCKNYGIKNRNVTSLHYPCCNTETSISIPDSIIHRSKNNSDFIYILESICMHSMYEDIKDIVIGRAQPFFYTLLTR